LIQVRLYFGTSHLFTLKELFNWKEQSGWNEFWVVGKDNYQAEMEFYGFLSGEEIAQRP
jgi:hypothetical protein